ncbi:hypothetical protein ACTVH1_19090 [Gluconobacter cerinus]
MTDRTGKSGEIWEAAWKNSSTYPRLETVLSWELSSHFPARQSEVRAVLCEVSKKQLQESLINALDSHVLTDRGQISVINGSIHNINDNWTLPDVRNAILCWTDMLFRVRSIEGSIYTGFCAIRNAILMQPDRVMEPEAKATSLAELERFATTLKQRFMDSEADPMELALRIERYRHDGREYLFAMTSGPHGQVTLAYRMGCETGSSRYRTASRPEIMDLAGGLPDYI